MRRKGIPKLLRRAMPFLLLIAISAVLPCLLARTQFTNFAWAQTDTDTHTHIPGSDTPPRAAKINPPRYGKMDSYLNYVVEGSRGIMASAYAASSGAHSRAGGATAVTVHVTEGYAESVRHFLDSNGASTRNAGEDYIEAHVPVSLLPSASEHMGVIAIRAIFPPQPSQGAIVSEGAAAHNVPEWHSKGYTGKDVRIGVIDIAFDGFSDLMGTELPQAVQAQCFNDLGTSTGQLSDCALRDSTHGTAVTEAIFDIAPDATYYISNAHSPGDLLSTVDWMVSNKVDVINHSVSWLWDGPGDGTSRFSDSPLRAVDRAVSSGTIWVNSAGNHARSNWFGAFRDDNGDGLHDFTSSSSCNPVELPEGLPFVAQLRWEDDWQGATRDLDLWLARAPFESTDDIVATSESPQAGSLGQIPHEVVAFLPLEKGTFCLSVASYANSPPDWIQLQAGQSQILEFHTPAYAIGNPAESSNEGLLAVGAARWNDTAVIEPFSSFGPSVDGRIKPDIVGADGGNSAIRGFWVGTSQASAHIAGLAALLEQRFPEHSPKQIAESLKQTATRRGEVPNNVWGYGFARLEASDFPSGVPPGSTQPTASCFTEIRVSTTISGEWVSDCVSVEPPRRGAGLRYSRFYTFTLAEQSTLTIRLNSDADTYLYLRAGSARDGEVRFENDDYTPSDSNSVITERLESGAYTIEATTHDAETLGRFTLAVELEATSNGPPSQPPDSPFISSGNYVQVSRGSDHACALRTDGSIDCWGADDVGQASPPSAGRFTEISSHDKGTCALRDDGHVLCWGSLSVNPR